jgi:hypothetical protein
VVDVDDLAGPLVLVVPALDPDVEVDVVDAGFVVVVLEPFAPVVLLVVLVLPEAAFGFLAVVVVVEAFAWEAVVLVVVVLLAAVATPAFRVVVVVGLAPLGRGTVQVRREEPS